MRPHRASNAAAFRSHPLRARPPEGGEQRKPRSSDFQTSVSRRSRSEVLQMEEGAGLEPAWRRRLAPLRTGCPTTWASPPSWRRGRDSNSRGRFGPRRVSGALDSLLVLSSPTICVLRVVGPLGRTPTSTAGFVARRSPALAYEGSLGRHPRNRTATSSSGSSRDHRMPRRGHQGDGNSLSLITGQLRSAALVAW